MNQEKVLDPIMIHNIKQENIIPNGGDVVAVGDVRTGVHKNTNMYIQDSIMLWINPRSNIRLFEWIRRSPSLYDFINSVSWFP